MAAHLLVKRFVVVKTKASHQGQDSQFKYLRPFSRPARFLMPMTISESCKRKNWWIDDHDALDDAVGRQPADPLMA